MKFSTALATLLSIVAVSADVRTISNRNAKAKLLRNARRLNQNNQKGYGYYHEGYGYYHEQYNYNQEGESGESEEEVQFFNYLDSDEENAFLGMYSIKMIGCFNDDDTTIAFRLCPISAGCNEESEFGCEVGHGDFLVDLDTYLESFWEIEGDGMFWDGNMDVSEYLQCNEYEGSGNDYVNGAYYKYGAVPSYNPFNEDGNFFIGPTCTDDNLSLRLAIYYDDECTEEAPTPFEDFSNGQELPFQENGLIPDACFNCLTEEMEEDEVNYSVNEFCSTVYEAVEVGCEVGMAYTAEDEEEEEENENENANGQRNYYNTDRYWQYNDMNYEVTFNQGYNYQTLVKNHQAELEAQQQQYYESLAEGDGEAAAYGQNGYQYDAYNNQNYQGQAYQQQNYGNQAYQNYGNQADQNQGQNQAQNQGQGQYQYQGQYYGYQYPYGEDEEDIWGDEEVYEQCAQLAEMLPELEYAYEQFVRSNSSSNAFVRSAKEHSHALTFIAIAAALGGIAAYVIWWRHQKTTSEAETTKSDGLLA